MEQDLDGIGLSADALAALREFALERGITVDDDDDSFDIRKEVQSALEEEKGPNEDKFSYKFGADIAIHLNGLRTFDVLIGADIIYEKDYVGPLFATASHFLARSSDANIFYLAYTKRNVSIDYVLTFGPSRGPSYDPSSVDRRFFNWTNTPSIAQIPQVPATYGYLEGVYPIMNDHHVALGESTCAAKFVSKPVSGGGLARLDIVELGRVALERTATARAAVMLMGELAETFGYYGSFWDTAAAFENSGEALTVTDPNEAWMVHILPDDTGASAIWVAQRIPDDHITAVANRFVIRRVDFSDTDNFMWSANMLGIAKHHGFWDGTTAFDFTSAYAGPPDITLSSTLRVGRVLSLANRHVDFNAFSDPTGTSVPFSVAVDNVLTAQDIIRVQRDHYEGTNADLTKGPAAGPYGDPNRYGAPSAHAASCSHKP
ncbi:hypothetical protein DYB32_002856 [Aphanomyces invadans]|uniref:Uncharacterized protein n=1 Tax=Aphanomyces invadans TaxID=157072 RepID=A0A3R6YCC0_9STRA|nr:hypothetical protein DYB32_002856 [Aphanomyces invadans]